MGSNSLKAVAWGSSQASSSLAVASAAWMVSGLTPMPFLNSLVPVLGTIPLVLRLPRKPLLGYVLQAIATAALLAVAAKLTGNPLLLSMLALLVLGFGIQIGHPPLERHLSEEAGVPLPLLRSGAETGRLVGNLLTAVLFPLGKALLQFLQALVLLLPILPIALTLAGPWRSERAFASAGAEPSSTVPPLPAQRLQGGTQAISLPPLNPVCCLQGLLFGSLFALLPLWVRKVGEGNCFDFGMVLTAYGLGKALAEATASRLQLPGPATYVLLALVLAATQVIPGWGAVLLFLPFGLLAGLADIAMVDRLDQSSSLLERWEAMGRSSTIGSLAGSVLMGLTAQVTGLERAFPVQLLAFGAAALLVPQLLRRS